MPDHNQASLKAMTASSATINGERSVLRCDRALAELRKGRWVLIRGGAAAMLVAAVDADAEHGPLDDAVGIAVTADKAADLGLATGEAVLLSPRPNGLTVAEQLAAGARSLVAGNDRTAFGTWSTGTVSIPAGAALTLLRTNRRLPAVFVRPVHSSDVEDLVDGGMILTLDVDDVLALPEARARTLRRAGEARVPLVDSIDTRFVVFRETVDDMEHVAIVIGAVEPGADTLVRMHSACLTGDLFGSLRCDCGEQLRAAVAAIADAGGGILLYLAQEGRGIGLTNKMRAYSLQDTGLDTVDADRCLGFGEDERDFEVAARILEGMGVGSVRLMTNNPEKIAALERHGIRVAERHALQAEITKYNERYMRAKAERSGHLLDGLEASDS